MNRCHICSEPCPHHRADCRIPSDLDLFERVYRRLTAEGRGQVLAENLLRFLRINGRMAA